MTTKFTAVLVLAAAALGAAAAPPKDGGWDQELLRRYPTAKAHDKARDATLQEMRNELVRRRMDLAAAEEQRQEFLAYYDPPSGRPPSGRLLQVLESMETKCETRRALVTEQEAQIAKREDRFRAERVRLEPLWSARPKQGL